MLGSVVVGFVAHATNGFCIELNRTCRGWNVKEILKEWIQVCQRSLKRVDSGLEFEFGIQVWNSVLEIGFRIRVCKEMML